MASIIIGGAGIVGLWQAVMLARHGHQVTLFERSSEPFADAASRLAGAMLAPYCEGEAAEDYIRDLGLRAIDLWRAIYPATRVHGSLVVTQPRDTGELPRFARLTRGHEALDAAGLAAVEPALAGRYGSGLFYPSEAHVEPREALGDLLAMVRDLGVRLHFGTPLPADAQADHVIDCRGLAAWDRLPALRGVRGEMMIIETDEIALHRPVRLLHPRFPLYVVPWQGGRFMIGATMIESADDGPVTLRSALELLGTAYALHPAFGEARIIDHAAGVRPAFPDNGPKIIPRGRHIYVNGLYRHGFLMAPVLAELVVRFIADGTRDAAVFADPEPPGH